MEVPVCFNCKNIAISNIEVHDNQGHFWIYRRNFCYIHLQDYWNRWGHRVMSGEVRWKENQLDRENNGFTQV